MAASILEKISQADNLPTLPTVAVQVLQLMHSDNASVGEIARVIENDPALTSKILKVANSSLFGMARQISSLQQAVVVLGMRTVKVMALTFSLVETMQNETPGGFDYRSYWRGSITTAVAARLLTPYIPSCRADELFVTALLADIGVLAAFHVDKDAYRRVIADSASAGVPLHMIEQEHFGVTHETFSSRLLETWGLPDSMVQAVSVHHQRCPVIAQATADKHNSTIGLLGGAVLISDLFCSPGGAAQVAIVKANVPQLVPVPQEALQDLLDTLHKQVEETASTWSLDIGTTRSYKDVQAEAVVQLARLTMAAELERAHLAVREEELSTQNKSLARKATMDGLTGIVNRITLEEHLIDRCRETAAKGQTLGLLLLDLDRFKRLNDTFGHQAGDAALRMVGEHLRKLNNDRCLAARYGGEEFAVVVVDASADDMRCLAEELRLGIQQLRVPCKEKMIPITVSIGATLFDHTQRQRDPAALAARAEKCLIAAKQTGRNRLVFQTFTAGATSRPPGNPHRAPAAAR